MAVKYGGGRFRDLVDIATGDPTRRRGPNCRASMMQKSWRRMASNHMAPASRPCTGLLTPRRNSHLAPSESLDRHHQGLEINKAGGSQCTHHTRMQPMQRM